MRRQRLRAPRSRAVRFLPWIRRAWCRRPEARSPSRASRFRFVFPPELLTLLELAGLRIKAGVDFVPDVDLDAVGFAFAIHHKETFGKGSGEVEITLANLAVELDVFLFHPVGHVGNAVFDALEAYLGGEIQGNREVGANLEIAGCACDPCQLAVGISLRVPSKGV